MSRVPRGYDNKRGLPGEQRSFAHHFIDFLAGLGDELFVLDVAEDFVNHADDAVHIGFLQATGGNGGRTDADAGSLECGTRVERNHVLVDGDVGLNQRVFSNLAGQIREFGAEVDQHQVVVGAVGDDLVTSLDE